jgi:ATP-binding cassette subfamily B protein
VHASLILVLERGRVVERGTHAELLAAGGTYARLYALQFTPAEIGTGDGESDAGDHPGPRTRGSVEYQIPGAESPPVSSTASALTQS